jgi:hypothetical protein
MHFTICDDAYAAWAATYPGAADALERGVSLCGTPSQPGPWNIDRVQAELPDVTVQGVWGTNLPAVVRGRMLSMARVHWRVGGQLYSTDFAWKAIVDALNSGTALRA